MNGAHFSCTQTQQNNDSVHVTIPKEEINSGRFQVTSLLNNSPLPVCTRLVARLNVWSLSIGLDLFTDYIMLHQAITISHFAVHFPLVLLIVESRFVAQEHQIN